jgi:hypothetical protein
VYRFDLAVQGAVDLLNAATDRFVALLARALREPSPRAPKPSTGERARLGESPAEHANNGRGDYGVDKGCQHEAEASCAYR